MNFTLTFIDDTEASTSTACNRRITNSMMKNCTVCDSENGNYKCPTCLAYYCSVTCCRKHRERGCGVSKINEKPDNQVPAPSLDMEYLTENTIPEERLQLLKNDEVLKDLLSNPHLRNVLKAVDEAPKPEVVMQKAMQEPLFVEFADACLKVVEPQDRTGEDRSTNAATEIQ